MLFSITLKQDLTWMSSRISDVMDMGQFSLETFESEIESVVDHDDDDDYAEDEDDDDSGDRTRISSDVVRVRK